MRKMVRGSALSCALLLVMSGVGAAQVSPTINGTPSTGYTASTMGDYDDGYPYDGEEPNTIVQ